MRLATEPLDWKRFLHLCPVRCVDWHEVDGRVVLTRPRPAGSGLRRLGGWLRQLLVAPRVRLDELGSFCWRRFDGGSTLGAVAEALRREFGGRAGDAEERVVRFARALSGEGWIQVSPENTLEVVSKRPANGDAE